MVHSENAEKSAFIPSSSSFSKIFDSLPFSYWVSNFNGARGTSEEDQHNKSTPNRFRSVHNFLGLNPMGNGTDRMRTRKKALTIYPITSEHEGISQSPSSRNQHKYNSFGDEKYAAKLVSTHRPKKLSLSPIKNLSSQSRPVLTNSYSTSILDCGPTSNFTSFTSSTTSSLDSIGTTLSNESTENQVVEIKLSVQSKSANSAPEPKIDPKTGAKLLCCDKCDGKHETNDCPYYKNSRETHPDAQKNSKNIGGSSLLPGAYLRSARVVRQPGDGSCLFHSISYGLKDGSTATKLRTEICHFIKNNPMHPISDSPLSDWVRWDSGTDCSQYAYRMSRGSWGGGIEMSCISHIKQVNVHVYEQVRSGYKRISAFDYPQEPERRPIVRVLYCGGVHYDALIV